MALILNIQILYLPKLDGYIKIHQNTEVDELLSEAQDEIVLPFFNIKKPKETEKKRHKSSIEINQNKKNKVKQWK